MNPGMAFWLARVMQAEIDKKITIEMEAQFESHDPSTGSAAGD